MYYYIITLWLASNLSAFGAEDVSYKIHKNKNFSYSSEVIYKKAPMYFAKDLNTK